MTTVTDIGTLIVEIPGICGGRARIAGTGVSIRRIAGWYRMGRSPEEIADQYGHLNLAQVHATLAYYHANRNQIDRELAEEESEYDRLDSRPSVASKPNDLADKRRGFRSRSTP